MIIEAMDPPASSDESKIFAKKRCLGYVSNHLPVLTRYIERRKENLLITCVGKEFYTYGASHFTLLSVSGTHPEDISCMAADTYHVYTASGNKIYAWRRGNELKHCYETKDDDDNHVTVTHLTAIGPHLIAVYSTNNVKVWDIQDESVTLELDFDEDIFRITCFTHPTTYMNKILFGSEQGRLQLWNWRKAKLIYTFNGWDSPISALESAPALDLMAVGLVDGRIIMHNLKEDKTLFQLNQDWGCVTAISFRSDRASSKDTFPIMATGSPEGHIVFWNLEERRVESQLLNAHSKAVTGLKCLPNEPLAVSSSPDNSLKLWIFDMTDGGARLLRIREGHAEPPTCIRFYGQDGKNILSSGGDSTLRILSTVTEIFNKSLGKAIFNRNAAKRKTKVMAPITSFSAETTREKDWDNIVTTHLGQGSVATWSYDKKKMGEHRLLPEEFKKDKSIVACCAFVTQCGNFVVMGYSNGRLERFNIQSGMHRASYGNENGAHDGKVKGVIVDPLNQYVASAGKDELLKFWNFKSGKEPYAKVNLGASCEWMRHHRESSLVAIALEDYTIVIVDLETKTVVREFKEHGGRLTDATFSPDCRWLISASMDCTIRTWDLPSAKLIDVLEVEKACTSLSFSDTGEYLASSHVDQLGLNLWTNKTLYSHVSLSAADAVDVEDSTENDVFSMNEMHKELITLSTVSTSRWLNLLNLDVVKKRNKPKEVKVSEQAPFFLPTIPSLNLQFDLSQPATNGDGNSKLIVHPDFSNLTPFGEYLSNLEESKFSKAIERLKNLGPSGIDFEIQSLSTDDLLLKFIRMLKYMMTSKRDFELAQAYLASFLKHHANKISADATLFECIDEIKGIQLDSWKILRDKLFYSLVVVQHLKTV